MNINEDSTHSGQSTLLIDFSVSTNTTKVYRPAKTYCHHRICKNNIGRSNTEHQKIKLSVTCNKTSDCQKINHDRPKYVKTKRGCDLLVYEIDVLFCVALVILNALIVTCEGRLFENPHRQHQRGILGGHGHPHHFSGAGILGRDQHSHDRKQDDPQLLAAEERRRMLKEYGVDGVVDVQDVGPDGKRRKKVRLGPIVFDPEAIRFDDLDDYNEYNDGPRSKIGRYDYDENEDSFDRDRLVPSRNGGGLNILNKLLTSLFNFGSFLCKLFSNLYRFMERQVKLINDRMAAKQTDQTSLPLNKEEDHGETSLVVIVIASWLIFGIIVALVTYVVNYWSDFVVGHYDAQEITRISNDDDMNVKEAQENNENDLGSNVRGNGFQSVDKTSLDSSVGNCAMEDISASRTILSSRTQSSSDVAVTSNLINDGASNRAMISSLAERSLPWIPVIGLVSPEESILFKKLVDTSNCSNDEKSTISNNKIQNSAAPQEDLNDSEIVELIDGRNKNENWELNDVSDIINITDSDNNELPIEGDRLDEKVKAIFRNSILLEKLMQKWKEALDQKAEIMTQRSTDSAQQNLTFIEPTEYASSSNLQTKKPEKSDSTLRFKPLPKTKKNGQGNHSPTRTERTDVYAMKKDTSDDSTSSDTNNSDLIIKPRFDAPNPLSIHNLSMTRCQNDAKSIENMQNSSDIMFEFQFESQGIFHIEETPRISSTERIKSDAKLEKNCNGSEIQSLANHAPIELYLACIKAVFQGKIALVSPDKQETLDDNQSADNVKLHHQIESSSTNGCKLSLASVTEDCKLLSMQPHTLKEQKHISTSTGFLKEISDTQEDQEKVYKSGSSKSVNFSDIKSKCDFRVATACFSDIKCLNPSVQYIRKISKENGNSNGIPAETSSLVSSNEIQLNIKVKKEKVEQWLTEVLSLLNKEYIISSSLKLNIVLPLRNKLSPTLIDPINVQHSNAMSNKKSDISFQKSDRTSMIQRNCDIEVDSVDFAKKSSSISDKSPCSLSNKNMSTLTVTIEQVSYSTLPMSRSISPTNDPSNQDLKHAKSTNTESSLTAENDMKIRSNAHSTVSFDSPTGFWQKTPKVKLSLDYPECQTLHTTIADTNSREMDEHGEETQSFAWANPQEFDLLISPSRTRELLIEVKDPTLQQDEDQGQTHLFCIVSIRDLLTTSNQKHIIPLLSFSRTSRTTDESLTSLKQHHVSDIEEVSESRTVAEKSSCHYRYSNIVTCHRNNSRENKHTMGQTLRPNLIEATVTVQFHYKPKSPVSRKENMAFSPDRPWLPPPLASVNKTFKAKWDTHTSSSTSGPNLMSCDPQVSCTTIYSLRPEVQQNLNQERQNRFRNGSYSQYQDSALSKSEETVLDEDKPTSIDVAIAATRDLHMHQARGYGAYALRSVMLIRYSQKQHCPISISSSKTSLVSGGVEKSASYSTIATTIKNKVETAAAPNSTFASKCDDKTNIMNEDKASTQEEILEENSAVKDNSQHENIARKKGGLFSTISTIKSKLVSRKRSHSSSPKEVRKWRSKMPIKRIIPKYGRRQANFRASTSDLSMKAKHNIGTILESSPLDQRKDIQSERPGSSDDSDSICSFTHSYNSLSEGSYELAPWHGKLSMSWESIGPDVMSSSLFLAPENAGNISDEASTFSDISTTSITGAITETVRPPAFKYLAYSGLDCNATATGASSSSTSMPEDQQNQTTFSIEEDAIMSEAGKLPNLTMKPGNTTPSKSWLVLETLEQPLNFTRHYLMPSQIEKRWRKREWSSQKLKGTRLHIFKDHVFVSKRVKSGSICGICQKRIHVRIGRKSYACRDCGLVCHKACHTKTDAVCPATSVNSMELKHNHEKKNLKQHLHSRTTSTSSTT